MNIFDRAIEKISPQTALRRESARWKLQTMRAFQNSGYDESGAARNKNSMRGWLASSKTPQEDIDKNIPVLRQRSRSLFMSAPLAVSAIKTNRTNIVGEGLRLKSTIDADLLGMTMDEAAVWQRAAEREFELWAKSKFCDSTRVNNFYEIQQVACMSWLMNGDACVLLEYERPTRALPYGLRVHLIESDRVSTPHSTGNNVYLYATDPDTKNRIFNGVEVDSNNRVVAYHICSTYPNSNLYTRKEWKRVKAFGDKTGTPNVLMIYETERAEQYSGVPYLATVIESLKQLTRYSEAEMMAAVINGFFTVFITSEKGTSEIGFTGVVDEDDQISDDDVNYEIGPGMVNMLGPGEGVEIADAKRPSSNFDAFTTSLAKYVGAALEIPVDGQIVIPIPRLLPDKAADTVRFADKAKPGEMGLHQLDKFSFHGDTARGHSNPSFPSCPPGLRFTPFFGSSLPGTAFGTRCLPAPAARCRGRSPPSATGCFPQS